jgi:peptide/nickel transport system substrate-binding protein
MPWSLDAEAREIADGELRLAWEAEPRTSDPRYAQDANSQYLEALLHCALIQYDVDGAVKGWLAQSWTWRSPTLLEVTLREGAKFANGSPVTARDVRATYLFFKKEGLKTPSPRRGAFTKLKAVSTSGDQTVLFELSEPDAAFVSNLIVGIIPESFEGREMLSDKDVVPGCGPFKLQTIDQGRIELAPNPFYGLGDKPKLRQVTIKIVKDENTRYAKLRAGELDLVQNLLSRDKVVTLAKKNPDLRIERRQGLTTTYLGFNMKDPLVARPEVRQAIAMAIDKEKIIKYILNGMAIPADALLPPDNLFYQKRGGGLSYDPRAAMELLDKAGLSDPDGPSGRLPRLRLTLKTTTDLTRVSIAKAIAAELKKIGIEVTVEALEWGRFKADVDAGRVQMWTLSWIGFKDPDIYRFAFATESFPPSGGNRGFYSNLSLDRLLASGKAETDLKKRQEIYGEVQALISRDLPYVFLWHDEIFALVHRRVSGFSVYADGRLASLSQVTVAPK